MNADRSPYPTFIVTAKLDAASFLWLDDLRKTHFPKELNILTAHLTMFHRLTAEQVDLLTRRPMPATALRLDFEGPRLLGKGVAIEVTCPPLAALRRDIVSRVGALSPKDAAGWRPHVTIQNKTSPEVARKLYDELAGVRRRGEACALQIWQYLGGPWAHKAELPFVRRGSAA